MAEQSLADKIAEYEKVSASKEDVPEAGAGHYLARGALQGVSALADLFPNLYNLGKAAVGVSPIPNVLSTITGQPKSTFMPEAGEANPISNFLLKGYGLDQPVRPASYLGLGMVNPEYGAAALEGMGAAAGQGPMALETGPAKAIVAQVLKQSGQNALIGAGGGVGAKIGEEAGGVPGAVIGGLAGGVVAPSSFLRLGGVTVGGVRASINTFNEMKNGAFGKAAKEAAEKIEPQFAGYISRVLRGASAGAPDAAENITEGLRLRKTIPGFNPSVAEMSGAPGLIDMQKKFALLSPQNLNVETARGATNLKAIEDYYRSKMPETEAPSSIRSAVNQSIADYEKLLADQARGVADKLPIADQVEVGTGLAKSAQAEKSAAKVPVSKAYQDAFNSAKGFSVNIAPVVAKAEEILGQRLSEIKPENAPRTVAAIKKIFGDKLKEGSGPSRAIDPDLMALEEVGGKKTATLEDMHAIRAAIGQDIASAGRSMDPSAATRLYNLGKLMPEVDATIEKFPPESANAYKAAVEKYKTEFAPRFKEGTPGQVFKDKSISEPKILPDRFVSEFFKPDSQAGGTRASQFGKLFGKNKEAKDLAKTGILDIYRQKVVNPTTGAIDQTAHNAFMRDYGRTLNAYRVMGIDAVSEIKRVAQQAAKVSADMDSLKTLSRSLKFDTVDDLTNAALGSPKVMGNVLQKLDPIRKQSFNTILLDKSLESGTAKGMRQFLETNRNTLSMTVPKNHLSMMDDIAKALEMTERAPIKGNIAAGGADMLKNASGISTATVFAQVRAVTAGRSSIEWGVINLAMPALNKLSQTSFANVMENALHSEQSAVALRNYLLATTPEQANNWAKKILSSMKETGKLAWALKGPLARNFVGPQRYPANLGRAGTAIRTQIPQQDNQ